MPVALYCAHAQSFVTTGVEKWLDCAHSAIHTRISSLTRTLLVLRICTAWCMQDVRKVSEAGKVFLNVGTALS